MNAMADALMVLLNYWFSFYDVNSLLALYSILLAIIILGL
jgi:hypothetical protein